MGSFLGSISFGDALSVVEGAGVSLVSFIVLESVAHDIDESAAGLLLASISLLAGVTRISAGAFADRGPHNAVAVGAGLLTLSSLG